MYKFIYVPQRTRGIAKIEEHEDIDVIITKVTGEEVGLESFETYEIEAFPGLGIIAQDQDTTQHKNNRLGIKGPFVVIGMERVAPGTKANPHLFTSIPEDRLHEVKFALIMSTMRDLQKEWKASE